MYSLTQSAHIFFFCLFSLLNFFSTRLLFFNVWYCTSQEAEQTSESTVIYPNELLPYSVHPWGNDTILESKEKAEEERQMEVEECIKKAEKKNDGVISGMREREQRWHQS